jgi:hypothetical protein
MDQHEGRGCDIPVSPPVQKARRAKRVFSPGAKAKAASLKKAIRHRNKASILELKKNGEFTEEMEEEEQRETLKKTDSNKR